MLDNFRGNNAVERCDAVQIFNRAQIAGEMAQPAIENRPSLHRGLERRNRETMLEHKLREKAIARAQIQISFLFG